jgi:hypothetical protein
MDENIKKFKSLRNIIGAIFVLIVFSGIKLQIMEGK